MAAVSAQELNIILTARDEKFAKAMERNQRRVEKFAKKSQKSLSKTGKSFNALGGAMRGLLPALGATILIGSIKKVMASLDEIGKTADNLGLTTDALQELRVVAESSGMEFSEFTKGFQKFSVNIGEAATGTGEALEAFKLLGVSFHTTSGAMKNAEQLFSEVSDAMNGIENASSKASIAADLFGQRVGVKMLNLMRNGSDGMAQMREEARKLGVVIDEDLIRNAEEAQTQLDLMSRVIGAQLSSAVIELAPLLVSAAGGIAKLTSEAVGFVNLFKNLGATAVNLGEQDVMDRILLLGDALRRFPDSAAVIGKIGIEMDGLVDTTDEWAAANGRLIAAEAELLARHERTKLVAHGEDMIEQNVVAAVNAIGAYQDLLEEREEFFAFSPAELADMKIIDEVTAKIRTLTNALMDAGVDRLTAISETDALFHSLLAQARATAEAEAAQRTHTKSLTASQIAMERYKSEVKLYETSITDLGITLDDFSSITDQFESSMTDALMSMVDGTATAKDAFRSMARDIIKELYRVLVVQQIVGAVSGYAQSAFGIGPAPVAIGNAHGGAVQAGSPRVVGEHGRELFIPSQAGRILSVGQAQQAAGSTSNSVVVQQTINVSTGVQQTVRAEVMQLMPQIANAAKGAVLDAKRRGGSFASAF